MTRGLIGLILAGLALHSVEAQEALNPEVISLEQLLKDRGLKKTDDPELHKQWLESVLHLYDSYGEILLSEEQVEKNAENHGEAVGFGWVLASTGSSFRIEQTLEGQQAGEVIPDGSVLLKIGDKAVTNSSFSALQTLIRSLSQEELMVHFSPPSGGEESLSLSPQKFNLPTIALKETLPESLGYLRLHGLFDGAERDVLKVLRSWTETDFYGLILDLRQASGTNLDAVEKIASLLVSEGQFLFAFRTLEDQDLDVRKAVAGGPVQQPVMILIDGETSGASEVLAATLAGTGEGVMLLGQPSAGDPMIREFIPFDSSYHLYITAKKLVTADGNEYLGKETIQPNVLVRTRDGTAPFEPAPGTRKTTLEEEGEDLYIRNRVRYDPVMRRAVDVLLGLKALNIRTPASSDRP